MSEVIDSKVVELKFNNAEFEKNVKTSLSTIERLKKSLNFDTVTTGLQTLTGVASTFSLKNITDQVTNIANTVDQSVTPIQAAVNTIASSITNTIGGAINSVVSQIESGGMRRAFNIEAAKFSLQGLGIEWSSVSKSINNAVSGTAYGLDQAAKAAAVLSASGISTDVVGKDVLTGEPLEELERDLKAVSGIAAQTGQDFDRIADVFSTIANNGKVMTMQVRQFSTYGLNATADLANYYGVAMSDIEEMLQKGEISANDFFDMMYNKYWENAGKANDTVTGVESNIKAALGRIGAAFVSPIVENKGPLNQFLNSYMNAINTVAGKLKQIGSKDEKGNLNEGKLTTYVTKNIIKYLKVATDWLDEFTKKPEGLLRVWRSVYRFLKGIFKMAQSGINFLEKIGQAFNRAFPAGLPTYLLKLAKVWTNFTNGIFKASKDITTRNNVFNVFLDIFTGIRGVIKSVIKQIEALIQGFKDFTKEVPFHPFKAIGDAFEYIGEAAKKFEANSDGFKNIFKGLWIIISNVASTMFAFGQAVIETMQEMDIHPIQWFGKVLKTLTGGLEANEKKTKRLKNIFKIFTTTIGAIVKVTGGLILVIAKVFNIFFKLANIVSYILAPIGKLISSIAELAVEIGKSLFGNLGKIGKKFEGVSKPVEKLRGAVEDFVDKAIGGIESLKNNLKDNIDTIKKSISNIDFSKFENLQRIADGVKGVFDSVKEAVGNAIDAIADFFSSGSGSSGVSFSSSDLTSSLEEILGFFDGIAGAVLTVKDNIVNFLKPALEDVKEVFKSVFGKGTRDDISSTNEKLEEANGNSFLTTIENILGSIDSIFGTILQNIGRFFADISEGLSEQMDLDEDASVYDVILASINLVIGFIGDVLEIIVKHLGEVVEAAGEVVKKENVQDLIQTAIDILWEINWHGIFMAIWDAASAMRNLTRALYQANHVYLTTRFKNACTGVAILLGSIVGSVLALEVALWGLLEIKKNYAESDINDAISLLKTVFAGVALLAVGFIIAYQYLDKPATKAIWKKGEGLEFSNIYSPMKNIGELLMAFSVAVGILTLALGHLVDVRAKAGVVKWEDAKETLDYIIGIIGLIAGIFGIINIFGKFVKDNPAGSVSDTLAMAGIGGTIFAFSVAVGILTLALGQIVKTMKDADSPEDVDSALMTLEILIWSLVGVILAIGASNRLTRVPDNVSNMSKFLNAATLGVLAWSIKTITDCFHTILNDIKDTKKKTVWRVEGILVAMATALLGIIYALSKFAKNAKTTLNDNITQFFQSLQMTTFSDSMRILVNLFTDLIKTLQGVKESSTIWAAAGIMTAMALALVGVMAAMAKMVQKLKIMPKEDLKSMGVLLAGEGVFAIGLWAMISLFDKLLNAIEDFDSGTIIGAAELMTTLAIELGIIILAMNKLSEICGGGDLKTKFSGLLMIVGSETAFWWGMFNIIDIFKQIIDATEDFTEDQVETAKSTFIGITTAFGACITAITASGTLKGAVASILGKQTYIGDLVTALEGGGLLFVILKLIDSYKELVWEVEDIDNDKLETTSDLFIGVMQGYNDMLTFNVNGATLKGIAGTMTSGLSYIGDAVAAVEAYALRKNVTKLVDVYMDLVDEMTGVSAEKIEATAEAFSSVIDGYAYLIEQFSGINFSINDIDTDELAEIVKDIIETYIELLNASTVPEEKDYPKMDKMLPWAETVANNASDALDEEVENSKTTFNTIGENITVGVADGMVSEDAKQNIKDAAEEVKDTAKESLEGSLDEHSPSKLMRDTIGKNITAGIAVGMTKYVTPLLKSSKAIGTTVLDSLANTKELASSVMDNWSLDPTITPVIDMSNVEAASGQLSGMFSSQTIGINANLNGISRSMRQIQNNDPNADLMSAINGLKDNINNNYTSYNVNGITYDDGSNIATAVQELISATNVQRRM